MSRLIDRTLPAFLLAIASASPALATMAQTVPLNPVSNPYLADSTGTLFSLTATQPTGSGIFSPFVRISRAGTSQGYNSTLDNGPSATMDLIALPGNASPILPMNSVVSPSGYIHLVLDYNEPGSAAQSLLVLQELLLVVSTDPYKSGPSGPKPNDPWSPQSIPLSPGDQVLYQMTSATYGASPFAVSVNAAHNASQGNGGSGSGDLSVAVNLGLVPNLGSLVDADHFLYVYSRFSGTGSGFEEWSVFRPDATTPIPSDTLPEPASLTLLVLGAAILLARRPNRSA